MVGIATCGERALALTLVPHSIDWPASPMTTSSVSTGVVMTASALLRHGLVYAANRLSGSRVGRAHGSASLDPVRGALAMGADADRAGLGRRVAQAGSVYGDLTVES